jgi:F420-non-reducing hydrogenase iron-sulfur subunit
MSDHEPIIVGFLCNWCSYAGADLAGDRKLPVPETFRAVRVMCSGRVEPQMVLKAFVEGADGVAIFGCHLGDCHYQEGNHRAMSRYALLRQTLPALGIDPARFRLEWVSASEGQRFADVVNGFFAELRELGPCRAPAAVQAANQGGER